MVDNQIELKENFLQQISNFYLNSSCSDIVFIVENEKLPAHRFIMAARSEYFRKMLYECEMMESKQKEIILEVPLQPFRTILKYVYSGNMPLSEMKVDDIIEILALVNLYGLEELEKAISIFLLKNLTLDNVCAIFNAASMCGLSELTEDSLKFMDHNAKEVVQHESFQSLSKYSLETILQRDTFFASEETIFSAVLKWHKDNPTTDAKSVVALIRFPLISLQYLFSVVRPSGLVDSETLIDIADKIHSSESKPYRAPVRLEENVATESLGSRTIQGENPGAMLRKGEILGSTSHNIPCPNGGTGIILQLGQLWTINHIKIELCTDEPQDYSYFVETSFDKEQWHRVIDYSQCWCRSWQYLYFDARPVRFIKLVGTRSMNEKNFRVMTLEAMFTNKIPQLVGDIVSPTDNVMKFTISDNTQGAFSGTLNNGIYYSQNTSSCRTWYGNRSLILRFDQPYYIGSLSILLLECNEGDYYFDIETSVDREIWQKTRNSRFGHTRLVETLSFSPRPIVFVKIIMYSNNNRRACAKKFRCLYIECPSRMLVPAKKEAND